MKASFTPVPSRFAPPIVLVPGKPDGLDSDQKMPRAFAEGATHVASIPAITKALPRKTERRRTRMAKRPGPKGKPRQKDKSRSRLPFPWASSHTAAAGSIQNQGRRAILRMWARDRCKAPADYDYWEEERRREEDEVSEEP